MASILVVDDEAIICDFLASLLGNEGHEVAGCQDGNTAMTLLAENPFDLVITDHRMQPMDGMELLKRIHKKLPTIPVILISGYGKASMVIEALKNGAFDFLAKPVGMETLQDTVGRALKYKKLMAGQVMDEEGSVPAAYHLDLIIGESPAMKEVCQKVQQVASVNTPVLISGPEGTGKSVVAEAIHRVGKRTDHSFAMLDCAVETEESLRAKLYGEAGSSDSSGLLFSHDGGTLHLRNIEKSSTDFQTDLFNILEKRSALPAGSAEPEDIDTRIIASTTASLIKLVGLNRFRPELYTRLARVNIVLKPLVERPEDVLPLFLHILRAAVKDPARKFRLEEKACLVLQHHSWPGNGDEMESMALEVLEKITDDVISLEMLPPLMVSTVSSSPQADPERNRQAAESLRGVIAKEFLRKKQDEYQAYLVAQDGAKPASGPDEGA